MSGTGPRTIHDLIDDLKKLSILTRSAEIHDQIRKENKVFLQKPYAAPQVRAAVAKAPVWFTAYLASFICPDAMTPLEVLGSAELWKELKEIGVKAVHTGPVMTSGRIRIDSETHTIVPRDIQTRPERDTSADEEIESDKTIDGWFDPIELKVDPVLGTDTQYRMLRGVAEACEATVIGDVVPGHTGIGADFHLALRGVDHYPGLYVMIAVDDEHWGHLPRLSKYKATEISRPLTKSQVSALRNKAKIIPGDPQRPMGPFNSNWSATRIFEDAKGVKRRWLYMHFFHPSQPTLNWIDCSCAAWRILFGELNYVMWELKSDMVRLDANSFLGLEIKPDDLATEGPDKPAAQHTISEAHPLSELATNMLAWQARRLGKFSFQELNMEIPEIAKYSELGPDLAYDFITRPACEHAVLTGKTHFLRIMYAEMEKYGVDPISLVHAMQNHDDITYELVHFQKALDTDRQAERFTVGQSENNEELQLIPYSKVDEEADKEDIWRINRIQAEKAQRGRLGAPPSDRPFDKEKTWTPISVWGYIRKEMRKHALKGLEGPGQYNWISGNGLCTTFLGLVGASLDLELGDFSKNSTVLSKGHLLIAAFNALQPGAFAFSGWDLVGALPLKPDTADPKGASSIPTSLLYSGGDSSAIPDFRWVNRGAYNLPGLPYVTASGLYNLSQTTMLYFDTPKTEDSPMQRSAAGESFIGGLQAILKVRTELKLETGHFIGWLDLDEVEGHAPATRNDKPLFGLLTWLPQSEKQPRGWAVTLLNFSKPSLGTEEPPQSIVISVDGLFKQLAARLKIFAPKCSLPKRPGAAVVSAISDSLAPEELQAEIERLQLPGVNYRDAFGKMEDHSSSSEATTQLAPWEFKLLLLPFANRTGPLEKSATPS